MRNVKIVLLCVLLIVMVVLAGCSGMSVRTSTTGLNYHNAESQGLPTWELTGIHDPVQKMGIERML